MSVLVLGSGVVGVTTAYYLAKAGHAVTVIDRQHGPALETSFANAGQISPGYASPWAAPGIPLKAIKWLLQEHAPLAIKPTADIHQYAWMWRMFKNCNSRDYNVNKERLVRLSEYSRDCLDQLRAQTGICYEGRQFGTTQVFRTADQLKSAHKDIAVLEASSVPYSLLTPEQLIDVEPALRRVSYKFTGALHLPNDQTGDCHLFTTQLASLCRDLGVDFRFTHNIERIECHNNSVARVITDQGSFTADYYVMALGSYSPTLLRSIGMRVPIYPLKGYSLTVPIVNVTAAPKSTILDESYKIAITRFDDRIRVGGMAEVSGYDLSLNQKRERTLKMVTDDIFPGGGDLSNSLFWTGLRPATPDGTPIIGSTPFNNLFMNSGHGTLGWTMACGSASLLADIISGNRPQIEYADLNLLRYG